VVFIDVGQGDSILLKTPRGKFILVDGGGSQFYDVAATRLLPYLHHRGIRKLFMAINTHPDTDHLLGLEEAAEDLKVHYLGIPHAVFGVPEYDKIKAVMANKRGETIPLYKGQVIEVEKDFKIRVLHPEKTLEPSDDFNQYSLVLMVEYKDWSVLLTGDAGREELEEIVKQGVIDPVTIVKVPHHGSRHSVSEDFYHHANPKWAVICVGNNSFGHPHADVLKVLHEQDINILRTDTGGNIYFDTSGRVETFK
jgi:competence protein ComEC